MNKEIEETKKTSGRLIDTLTVRVVTSIPHHGVGSWWACIACPGYPDCLLLCCVYPVGITRRCSKKRMFASRN